MLQRYLLSALLLITPLLAHTQSVEFVRNDGQWDGPYAYAAVAGQGKLYLGLDTFTYVLSDARNRYLIEQVHTGAMEGPVKLNFHAYRMIFEGASKPEIVGSKPQSWYYNYFHGNDQRKWKSGIHPNLALDYNGLYKGIDMRVFSEKGNVKYEFKVAPGADPAQIRLRFDGASEMQLKDGNLLIRTSVGEVKEMKPYTYQYIDGKERKVGCRYRLKGNTISYDLDAYDASRLLIIDPTIVFATFSGSTADNWGFTATYDATGNFYAGGFANPEAQAGGGFYPTTPGAFQSTFGGGFTDLTNTDTMHGSDYASDITIMKFNPTGTNKIYATYIGGNDNEQPHSMIVDANDNLIIAGRSYSSNFPTTTGAYDQTHNGRADIVVVKLNATGTALVGSTFVGGSGEDGTNFDGREPVAGNLKHNYGDDARSEVLVDNSGNVYVTACTKSTNFPVTANAFQSSSGGAQDGVVFKLNPNLTALTWSTYIGGSADDAGYVLALDRTQTSLYVAGGTQSTNFPAVAGGWKAAYQGGSTDGYILKFTNSGNYPLVNSTFIGTSNYDQCFGVQVDLDNNVYAMGQTLGGSFPVTPGVYSNAGSSQFIIKLNPTLSTNIYSTVFGSGNSSSTNISPVAFLVDTCQNVYISGWGGDLGFVYPGTGNTFNMPLSTAPNPPAQSTTDGKDFYFFVLSKNAQSLLYASYLGGTSAVSEHVDGGTSRFDRNGVIYQAICGGCGGSSNFPTTPGSWSVTNNAQNCNLIAVKIAFNLGAVGAGAQAAPTTRGCPPLTVQFANNSTNATSYIWDFRDNTPNSTQATPQHTFTSPGVYNVRLVANNPNACKTSDTTYVTITVDSNHVTGSFEYTVLDSCGPYRVSFNNTSLYGTTPGSQSFTTFYWNFGDNTSFNGTTPPVHSYSGPGTYTVTMVMRDTTACNSPDTVRKTVTISSSAVRADFSVLDSLCVGTPVSFTGNATNATGISWSFGDGHTDTARNLSYTYAAAGTYTVTFTAVNPNTCNKIDSITKTVTVSPRPHADFTFTPVIPVPNTPIQFTNASTGATSYSWSFGDGSNSTEVNPSHLYRRTGRYTACLVAKNKEGCTDTVCKGVEADVQTGIDLPTAFSPNGDGSNDRYFPRGGGIETMDFRIFNRWGQLVFEAINAPANDPAYGWDGTYKGKDQEMDVYAFVLNVTYIDGTTAQRKGNVTLLR